MLGQQGLIYPKGTKAPKNYTFPEGNLGSSSKKNQKSGGIDMLGNSFPKGMRMYENYTISNKL